MEFSSGWRINAWLHTHKFKSVLDWCCHLHVIIFLQGDLIFYINGESQGVAAEGIPRNVYGIVDLYGKCVQVTITSPLLREHNNDDCLSGSSMLAIDNDILNVTLCGDLSELSFCSSNSLDIRMDMNVR